MFLIILARWTLLLATWIYHVINRPGISQQQLWMKCLYFRIPSPNPWLNHLAYGVYKSSSSFFGGYCGHYSIVDPCFLLKNMWSCCCWQETKMHSSFSICRLMHLNSEYTELFKQFPNQAIQSDEGGGPVGFSGPSVSMATAVSACTEPQKWGMIAWI